MKETRKIKRLVVGVSSITESLSGLLSSAASSGDIKVSVVCGEGGPLSKKFADAGIEVYKNEGGVNFYLKTLREMSSCESGLSDTKIIVSGGAKELSYALKLFRAEKPYMEESSGLMRNVMICGGEIGYVNGFGWESFCRESHAIKEILDSGIEPVLQAVYETGNSGNECKSSVSERLLKEAVEAVVCCDGSGEWDILKNSVKLHIDIAASGENKGELLIDSRERPESPNAWLWITDGRYEDLIEKIYEKNIGDINTGEDKANSTAADNPGDDSAESRSKRVILDADTGSDDAVSIMCAALCGRLEIEAICSVWGNSGADNTADNAVRVMSLMGKRVPVYKGLDTALCRYQEACRRDRGNLKPVEINGEVLHMHVDTLPIPEAAYKREEKNAVSFYIEFFSKPENKGTSILATGPLSNLGLALSIKPDIAGNIGEIIIMGGGLYKANITPFSEANFNHDPEAANIVLNCGAEVVLIPLDLTHRAVIKKDEIEEIKALNNPCALFAAELLRQRSLIHDATQPLYIPHAATVHDAMTAAYAADSSIVTGLLPAKIKVIEGGDCEGHCALYRRRRGEKPNCRIALYADREKFADFIKNSLAGCGKDQDLPGREACSVQGTEPLL